MGNLEDRNIKNRIQRSVEPHFSDMDHVQQQWFLQQEDDSSVSRADPVRLVVEDIYSVPGIGTIASVEIHNGTVSVGDEVVFQPSDANGKIKSVNEHSDKIPENIPFDNTLVGIRGLRKEEFNCGDVGGPADSPPSVVKRFQAQIAVKQHPSVLTEGYTPDFQIHTSRTACAIESIDWKLDPSSGDIRDAGVDDPDYIQAGDSALVTVRPQRPISVETATTVPELGVFTVHDMNMTIAIGRINRTGGDSTRCSGCGANLSEYGRVDFCPECGAQTGASGDSETRVYDP
ncbi:elongation factor 1-alpha C-terminal domain-related protein [Halosegnis longus]|uniref:elongation factor 1-alpha C-terminal domain-related protein n=1 Tax=Halosegnis longus TaxID=2216012 RepID=UPI0009ABE608|nr:MULTISPECIES: hypothetical protein [Halobacteriales]